MKKLLKISGTWMIVMLILIITGTQTKAQSEGSYSSLLNSFINPDYAKWGEVPLWWWEADSLSKERVTWELEKLSEKGVKAVCPIQRSPARSYPASFSKEWWEMIAYTHQECERLGMHLWLYDQVGYGQYGWLEKAAAQIENTATSRIAFFTATGKSNQEINIELSNGELLAARAYPIIDYIANDEKSIDIKEFVNGDVLTWTPPNDEEWKVAVSVLVPYKSFYMNEASADVFLQQLYQKIEDVVGAEAMGKSLAGVFQDEHPPTPRDIYTQELADTFQTMFGYSIERAIPAQHFDVGAKTPKYRIDYFDAYLAIVEKTYWKKVYDWTANKNLLTSHDNWGRNNIYRQSEGYIDYFRTQRWFSSPGFDDWGQKSIEDRNYYDTKIASSIARLYNRPRVWAEAFHSSGWGRTTNQTLSWLSALYAFGANLYDEHGLYYSLNASTWEHAAPDPHWRQPYWDYYQEVSNWVARTSYLMSQGEAVADVAVHYPVVSLLADMEKNSINYNDYMKLSRTIYNEGMDNDIIDDQSILDATVKNGRIEVRGNSYQALVFGPEKTMRLAVVKKALELVQSGGVVLFYMELPQASVENGRQDRQLASLLEQMLGELPANMQTQKIIEKNFKDGGFAAFVPELSDLLPALLSTHIDRDFVGTGGDVFVSHRRIGSINVYLVQNIEDKPIQLKARFRADGVPEIWDPLSGEINVLNNFERKTGYTYASIYLEGNVARLIVLNPGKEELKKETASVSWNEKALSEYWDFSVIPTRDNQWGDFEWPPSNEKIGPEVRQYKYKEENGGQGIEMGWNKPGFDDRDWNDVITGEGPYWLLLKEIPENGQVIESVLAEEQKIESGNSLSFNGASYTWENVTFSQKTGLNHPAPWGGHSGYPDGHYDKNFIHLNKDRNLLFTRIYSPENQRRGLNVQLRNKDARIWVNGKEEYFSGAVGNLPLKKGYNNVLLEVSGGTGGMLYVQKDAPELPKGSEGENESGMPELNKASWIWSGNSEGAYFRKSIEINETVETAYVTVTGVSGFSLFINGKKVEEDIGPWATWTYPKRINIKPYLQRGRNVFAAWGQFFQGINIAYTDDYKGFILAMKAVTSEGNNMELLSDGSWKGNPVEVENWETLNFNDSGWTQVDVKGKSSNKPWGNEFLENVGSSTTPYRPLSVTLNSPVLEVFNEMPTIVYDVKPENAKRIGWVRFEAPPGLKGMTIKNKDARAWVNGTEVPVKNGKIELNKAPVKVSQVAIRINMEKGKYAGAVFEEPVKLWLEGGIIKSGLWKDYALPTYSGIVVYKQKFQLNETEIQKEISLDLGEVLVASEVFVNGKSAGVKVAKPFKFNISNLVKQGENEIEVRVANTLAPHYSLPRRAMNLGPVESGLIGPVHLRISR
jgi:hypothetical protein